MYQYVKTYIENGAGYIILNDPKKLNALSQPMAAELSEVLEQFRFDPQIRVIVLRGEGGRFCAGGDITSMKKRVDCYAAGIPAPTQTKTNMANFNHLVLYIRQIEKPVVAWIEGACAGGGMSLAMACDFAIAEENTKMSFAFSSIGLAPDMGSSVLLTRRVGPARAADLFMTGRRFTGKEAADMGIITRAVPAEELEENVKITLAEYLWLTWNSKEQIFRMEFKDKLLGSGRTMRGRKMTRLTDMRVIVDASCVEVFLNGGKDVFSTRFYPDGEEIEVTVSAPGAKGRLRM